MIISRIHILILGYGMNSRNNLNNHTFLSVDKKFDWPSLNIPVISTKGTCKALKDQIGILVNGDVVSCCLDNNGDNKLGIFLSKT